MDEHVLTYSKQKPLNVSIVRYENSFEEILHIVEIFLSSNVVNRIFIVDNSKEREPRFQQINVEYIFNNHNLGFGKAHNIAICKSIECQAKYHIVSNADIVFEKTILKEILSYLDQDLQIGALMPKVVNQNGELQYLCKLLPSPIDLFSRRFLPRNLTKRILERFELRDCGYNKVINIPYLSGCFMALRIDALKKVGIFDERFFLYPEDIDLSRRIHEKYKTVFFPDVVITHVHNRESYKNIRMLWIHVTNLILYFNKWGWVFDNDRKKINDAVLQEIRSYNNN